MPGLYRGRDFIIEQAYVFAVTCERGKKLLNRVLDIRFGVFERVKHIANMNKKRYESRSENKKLQFVSNTTPRNYWVNR